MTAVLKKDFLSATEYFALLEESNERYELVEGQIYAMAGGSFNHSRIIRKLSRLFDIHLENTSCEVLSEFMLRVDTDSDNYVYPDLLVQCNLDSPYNYVTEPKLIIEVISESTMRYDLTKKFDMYRTLDSLQEYVTIEQASIGIDIYRRADDWQVTRYEKGDEVEFQSIGLTIPIVDIYASVEFAKDITIKHQRLIRNIKTKR